MRSQYKDRTAFFRSRTLKFGDTASGVGIPTNLAKSDTLYLIQANINGAIRDVRITFYLVKLKDFVCVHEYAGIISNHIYVLSSTGPLRTLENVKK